MPVAPQQSPQPVIYARPMAATPQPAQPARSPYVQPPQGYQYLSPLQHTAVQPPTASPFTASPAVPSFAASPAVPSPLGTPNPLIGEEWANLTQYKLLHAEKVKVDIENEDLSRRLSQTQEELEKTKAATPNPKTSAPRTSTPRNKQEVTENGNGFLRSPLIKDSPAPDTSSEIARAFQPAMFNPQPVRIQPKQPDTETVGSPITSDRQVIQPASESGAIVVPGRTKPRTSYRRGGFRQLDSKPSPPQEVVTAGEAHNGSTRLPRAPSGSRPPQDVHSFEPEPLAGSAVYQEEATRSGRSSPFDPNPTPMISRRRCCTTFWLHGS